MTKDQFLQDILSIICPEDENYFEAKLRGTGGFEMRPKNPDPEYPDTDVYYGQIYFNRTKTGVYSIKFVNVDDWEDRAEPIREVESYLERNNISNFKVDYYITNEFHPIAGERHTLAFRIRVPEIPWERSRRISQKSPVEPHFPKIRYTSDASTLRENATGDFDLKSFMINEGLTSISRDRKKLVESIG